MTDIWLNLRHKYEPLERVNIVHFNDIHENTNNIDSFITGRDEFYKSHPNETNLTLAAGDIFNRFPQNERIVSNFVKDYVDASATGNRDLEKGKRFNKSIQKYGLKDKFVGTNVYYDGNNPLSNKIVKSKIVNNIGIIGLAPVDFKPRLERKDNTNIKTEDLKNSLETVRKEAEQLEKQGINKIVLLAHTGEFSARLARPGCKWHQLVGHTGRVHGGIRACRHRSIRRNHGPSLEFMLCGQGEPSRHQFQRRCL